VISGFRLYFWKKNPLQKLVFAFAASLISLTASSQYWQQKVDYVIDVSLNDKEKTLDAFEKISYLNNSPDTLAFIWFHVWPNAYKNDRTAFSDQLLENGNTKFYFADKEERGYINRLDFKVDGTTAKTEDHPEHIDILKLILPKPLPPGQKISITTPFHVKLPYNFSRGGYDGNSFQVTQWYPKPAVYDREGWHPMPYLDQGEFYSEFGDFDVRITVPRNYVIAATGILQNQEEIDWLKTRQVGQPEAPVKKAIHARPGKPAARPPVTALPEIPVETKTISYKQTNVHDFAWFAEKNFIVNTDSCLLSSGRIIQVFSFYTPKEEKTWKNSIRYTKDAVRFYSDQVGEYPYDLVTVVQGPQSFGGGMEYPTITIISPASSAEELDETITHEVGHNWFYGVLASNERDHPWMDEGINSFYEDKYMEGKYGRQPRLEDLLYETKAVRRTAQPIETPSQNFSVSNYELVAYHETAEWMRSLEASLGKESFSRMMHRYFEKWKFRHPLPRDFKEVAAAFLLETNQDTSAIFRELSLALHHPWSGFKLISPLKKGSINSYLLAPVKNILFFSPAFGLNSYDKLMVGGLLTNYKLPPNRFQFLAIPLYATGSKKFTGLGKLEYSFYSDRAIRKAELFVNGSGFSMDDFRDSAGRRLIMGFRKIVPGIRITLREKDPRSTVNRYIQWKTFFIREQGLRVIPDTLVDGTDTSFILRYLLPRQNRWLNQLRFVYENHRALYPFDLTVQIEQSKDFLRPAITADYFFNYKEGGLRLRFFAGKFIYLNGKTVTKQFENDRYFLNMTGANGYEDYTYSDYFAGRNRFEGLLSQQIMNRDGGFKVRSDLLASKIGKTDNWLAAINLNTSIPRKINPLSVLPVRIPLFIFLDIGTYAEAWERNSNQDRFLYDTGFHIPLFHEVINIYIPVLYNKIYADYFKSTIPKNRFFKTMSFEINLYPKGLKKMNRELEL
jgi:hypothetical protein